MKISVSLYAATVVVVLVIAFVLPCVTANSEEVFNNSWYSDGPQVTFYAQNATTGQWVKLSENPVICSDNDNVTLRVHVEGPTRVDNSLAQDYIRWWMGYLTSVTYKAGWEYNKEIQVYANSSNSGQKTIDFELTDIPHYGNHTLEVVASCVVYIFGSGPEPLYFSGYHEYLDFTVTPKPTATETHISTAESQKFSLEQAAIVATLAIILAVIFVVVYKRNRRSTSGLANHTKDTFLH